MGFIAVCDACKKQEAMPYDPRRIATGWTYDGREIRVQPGWMLYVDSRKGEWVKFEAVGPTLPNFWLDDTETGVQLCPVCRPVTVVDRAEAPAGAGD